MIDFLNLFMDVFLFPLNPENLNFENNPVMIVFTAVLLGIGFFSLLRRLLWSML